MRLVDTSETGRVADALRRAAVNPAAPRRLHRAADAVTEGKFSWDDAASGQCAHPYSQSLFTAAAAREMWPTVLDVIAEDDPVAEERAPEDEDFSVRTYLR